MVYNRRVISTTERTRASMTTMFVSARVTTASMSATMLIAWGLKEALEGKYKRRTRFRFGMPMSTTYPVRERIRTFFLAGGDRSCFLGYLADRQLTLHPHHGEGYVAPGYSPAHARAHCWH